MNCRDFLNEFEERNRLSDAATLHLSDCADCRKISAVQTRLWRLIDGFESVDAPNDFDFRVKARIAGAKPSDFQSPFFPVLRYVLPLSVVIMILALVVLNGIYSLDNKTVPAIAEHNRQMPIQKQNSPAEPSTFEQSAANVSQPSEDEKSIATASKQKTGENEKETKTLDDETRLIAVRPTKKLQVKSAKDDHKNFDGSQLNSVSPPRIFMPKGIPNLPQTNEKPSNFENANSMTAEQILLQLGIETSSKNGKWQVKTIKQNSVAERSDVKVGDWVEAIDGEKLTSEPIRAKTIEGKKLTVVRGAEKKEIFLRY
jgi:hypothetical protein